MEQASRKLENEEVSFTATRKMMIIQNMGKGKEKLKKKNTTRRNKIAPTKIGIVN